MIRDDWKHLKLALFEMNYGKQAREWNDIYPPVRDDRRVYINICNLIVEAINSLPDNPHNMVCVAMNRYIAEEKKVLDEIKSVF